MTTFPKLDCMLIFEGLELSRIFRTCEAMNAATTIVKLMLHVYQLSKPWLFVPSDSLSSKTFWMTCSSSGVRHLLIARYALIRVCSTIVALVSMFRAICFSSVWQGARLKDSKASTCAQSGVSAVSNLLNTLTAEGVNASRFPRAWKAAMVNKLSPVLYWMNHEWNDECIAKYI